MKQLLFAALTLSLLLSVAIGQKVKTIMGDSWNGVVESTNEATREIKVGNPGKTTDTFTGVLEEGYQVKLKDGSSRELKVSELKPGVRIRVFFKSKTMDVAGQKTKVNIINRIQFLGRDEYTRLREMLKLQPSIAVVKEETDKLPAKDPYRIFLAFEPENLDKGFIKWVDQWNKLESAKHGRVEIVNDLEQADSALVVIWGQDDSFITPQMLAYDGYDLNPVGFGTAYLASKDASGLHLLWQSGIAVDPKKASITGELLGKPIEKKLKARSK